MLAAAAIAIAAAESKTRCSQGVETRECPSSGSIAYLLELRHAREVGQVAGHWHR